MVTTDKKPSDLDVSSKEMDSWFGLLDDASKADVMKAKIAADATTEQCRIKEEQQTERVKAQDNNFTTSLFTVKAFLGGFILVAVLAVCITTCNVAEQRSKVDLARVQVTAPVQPPPTAQAAAPPASAAPASSGK